MTDKRVTNALRKVIPQKRNTREWPAKMGNHAGVVLSATRAGYVYVRLYDGQVWEVWNTRVPNQYDLDVVIGYADNTKVAQVLRTRYPVAYTAGSGAGALAAHHSDHEFPNTDTVWVRGEQVMPLNIIPSGFTVSVYPGVVPSGAGWVEVQGQSLDLSGYTPATGQKYMLIQVDNTGVVSAVEGAELETLALTDIPSPTAGCIGIGAVKLYFSQQSIRRDGEINDIVDLRWLASSGDVSAVNVTIGDDGGYYAGTDVEAALQEIGAGTTLDGRYIKIDQSTPQTITGGIPLLEETRIIDDEHELVDKLYVDTAVTSIGARYYMTDDASGIEDYKLCQINPPAEAEASDAHENVVDDEYLRGWIAPSAGVPPRLVAGVYNWVIYAQQTGGTGKKTARVYWNLIERESDGNEIIIATSANSNVLGTAKARYDLILNLPNDYEIANDSYVLGRVYADVSGTTGGDPSITLFYRGVSPSRWEIPTNTEVLDTLYQPLDSDLTAIAALTPENDDIIQRKSGVWTNRTMAELAADLPGGGGDMTKAVYDIDDDGVVDDSQSTQSLQGVPIDPTLTPAADGNTLVWNEYTGQYEDGAGGGGPSPSDDDPEDIAATPGPGISDDYSRADHVHAGEHNSLASIQGGAVGEYYHFDEGEHAVLQRIGDLRTEIYNRAGRLPTAAVSAGGSVPEGVNSYFMYARDSAGIAYNTFGAVPTIIVTTTSVNKTVTLSNIVYPPGVLSYDIYRQDPSLGAPAPICFLANTALTTFVDNGSVALDCGIVRPTSNTTTENPAYPPFAEIFADRIIQTVGTGFSVTVPSTSQLMPYFYYYVSSAANANAGDTYEAGFWIAAGTYKINTLGVTFNSFGKVDYYIDGVSVSTGQDWYSSSATFGVEKTITGIAVPTNGYHVLKIVVNDKNASSGDYRFGVTKITFIPSTY